MKTAILLLAVCNYAVATEMFPSLRKHKKASLVSTKTTPSVVDDAVEAAPATATNVAQVAVPAPPDAGPDGMPLLPAVSEMVSGAAETLKSISQQASVLETRAAQVQKESASKMSKMKAFFEENLKKREQENLGVVSANGKISNEIDALKKDNTARRKHATELVEANNFMRSEINALEQRLGAAKDFADTSLKATDDRKAKELVVLDTKAAPKVVSEAAVEAKPVDTKAAEKSSDDDDDDDATEEATSFVGLASHRHHRGLHAKHQQHQHVQHQQHQQQKQQQQQQQQQATVQHVQSSASAEDGAEEALDAASAPAAEVASKSPADIVQELTAGVAHLAEEQTAMAARGKALYAKDVKAETARHKALLQQQQQLNSTRSSLQQLQAELGTAETHLTATETQLTERLHNLGLFIQHLSHLALAPAAEAPNLLKTLPEKVTEPASTAASTTPAP